MGFGQPHMASDEVRWCLSGLSLYSPGYHVLKTAGRQKAEGTLGPAELEYRAWGSFPGWVMSENAFKVRTVA